MSRRALPNTIEQPVDAEKIQQNFDALAEDVTLGMLADMATASVVYRKTAGNGAPEVQTLATLKTDFVLVKADVGLGNVDNTSDANKPVSTATQTALNLKAPLASPTFTGTVVLPAATVTLAMQANMATASVVYRKTAGAGVPEVQTLATLKTDLTLVKADVGLGSVDNTSDAGKPVSTAGQTALNLKANLASPTFTGTVTVPGLTISDATDITINATTGTKIGQSGSKIGFFGVTPVVRPTAITQTYATTSSTHANVTQIAAPAGGTGATAGAYDTAAHRDAMITSVNAAMTDIANVKQVLNIVIDQLQALGLLQ